MSGKYVSDDFLREMTTLVDALLGDAPIEYEWLSESPEQWKCTLCGEETPVVYRPCVTAMDWSFHPTEPCAIDTFPHSDGCPVAMARRLQYYVR